MATPKPRPIGGTERKHHEPEQHWRLGGKPNSYHEGDGLLAVLAEAQRAADWELSRWRYPPGSKRPKVWRCLADSPYADALQTAAKTVLEEWKPGTAAPFTLEELTGLLVRRAKNQLHGARRRISSFHKHVSSNTELVIYTLQATSMLSQFHQVHHKQRSMRFYTKLFAVLGPSERRVLYAVLKHGIPFEDTRALQHFLCFPTLQEVTNIKRRIIYAAKPILRELADELDEGDNE